MGRMSRKIGKQPVRVEEKNKTVAVTIGDEDATTTIIKTFCVDGKKMIKLSDIMLALGAEAAAKGAVSMMEQAGFKRDVDFWVVSIPDFAGKHAVATYETTKEFLKKINVPVLRSHFWQWFCTELTENIKMLDVVQQEPWTIENGKLVHKTKEVQKEDVSQDDFQRHVIKQITSQTEATVKLAELYKEQSKKIDELTKAVNTLLHALND